MDANERRDLPNGEQRAICVRTGAVPRVVTERQLLIRHPEDDFGADHVTGQTNGVNLRAGNGGASGLSRAEHASSEPAQPVAPARHTLRTMEFAFQLRLLDGSFRCTKELGTWPLGVLRPECYNATG